MADFSVCCLFIFRVKFLLICFFIFFSSTEIQLLLDAGRWGAPAQPLPALKRWVLNSSPRLGTGKRVKLQLLVLGTKKYFHFPSAFNEDAFRLPSSQPVFVHPITTALLCASRRLLQKSPGSPSRLVMKAPTHRGRATSQQCPAVIISSDNCLWNGSGLFNTGFLNAA